jgi:hypothetical protein
MWGQSCTNVQALYTYYTVIWENTYCMYIQKWNTLILQTYNICTHAYFCTYIGTYIGTYPYAWCIHKLKSTPEADIRTSPTRTYFRLLHNNSYIRMHCTYECETISSCKHISKRMHTSVLCAYVSIVIVSSVYVRTYVCKYVSWTVQECMYVSILKYAQKVVKSFAVKHYSLKWIQN